MKVLRGVVLVFALVGAASGAAFAQFPGEPNPPLPYDSVADMKYHFARGAPDATVREAQRLLQESGFYAGPLDGIMGPDVKSAIWRFQQTKGLRLSGSLDRLTLAELGVGGTGAYASPPSADFGRRPERLLIEDQAP